MILFNSQSEKFKDVGHKQAMVMILSGKWVQVSCNAELSYAYARYVIKQPWPPGEAAIAHDPEWAYRYARDLIENAWPAGETAIASDPDLAYYYAGRLNLTYDETNNRFT